MYLQKKDKKLFKTNCVLSNAAANQATTFAITDTKVYVPVVTVIN